MDKFEKLLFFFFIEKISNNSKVGTKGDRFLLFVLCKFKYGREGLGIFSKAGFCLKQTGHDSGNELLHICVHTWAHICTYANIYVYIYA